MNEDVLKHVGIDCDTVDLRARSRDAILAALKDTMDTIEVVKEWMDARKDRSYSRWFAYR